VKHRLMNAKRITLVFLALSLCPMAFGADELSSLEQLDQIIVRLPPSPPESATNLAVLLTEAKKDDARAQCFVGLHYISGVVVAQNMTDAVHWLRKSADQGFPPAEYTLGILFKRGLGVSSNRTAANQWFQKASDQGYVPAKHEAALIADHNGKRKEAVKLLHEAADKGFPSSEYLMGCILADPIERYKWLSLAAPNVELARPRLLGLRQELTKEQLAEAEEGIRKFKRTAASQSPIEQ
jgi:TPR repeat protein